MCSSVSFEQARKDTGRVKADVTYDQTQPYVSHRSQGFNKARVHWSLVRVDTRAQRKQSLFPVIEEMPFTHLVIFLKVFSQQLHRIK